MKSKTIILSNSKQNGRGILTLYIEDDLLKAKLRLYNVSPLNPHCKLGVYHNQEVSSANLILKNGQYTTSLVGSFNLDADFYTAIVDTSANNNVILSGGTYAGYYFDDNSVFNNIAKPSYDPTQKEAEPEFSPLTQADLYTTKPKTSQTNNQTEQCEYPDCAHCKYKEFFYSSNNQTEQEQTHTNTTNALYNHPSQQDSDQQTNPSEEAIPTIAQSLIPQINSILSSYPENSELTKKIENSKFVSITTPTSNYSLGAIYQDQTLKYICYATKCNYNTPAPEELGKNYQWLPCDPTDPLSEGYYIVYQDATDLKIIEV